MSALGVILIVLLLLLLFYLCKTSTTRIKNFPPGPPSLPFFGSYWYLLKEDYYFVHRSTEIAAKRYGTDILGLHLGPFPTIVVFGNALCREASTKEEFAGRNDTLLNRGRSSGDLAGIFFIDGPYWKEQRRFSLRHLRDLGFGRRLESTERLFEQDVRDLIDMLTSEPKPENDDICRKKGEVLSPEFFSSMFMNSVLQMLVGRQFDPKLLRNVTRRILKILQSGDATGNAVTIYPWLRYVAPSWTGYAPIMDGNRFLVEFMSEQVRERKLHFSDDYHADLLDVLMTNIAHHKKEDDINMALAEKQMLWVLIDYMFPSSVTVGQTLNYLWAYLLNHPQIQVKMQEEIDRVVGRSRLPNLDDRKNMPYLEAVIREALRKSTINTLGIPRRCMADTTFKGYFIPKDTIVLVHLWSAHNDPRVWKEPEVFRPERFLDEEGNLLKKDYTLGFGAGKRLCAGETISKQMMFLLVSGLVQNFTFEPADEMPDPEQRIWGVLVATPPFWMRAVAR